MAGLLDWANSPEGVGLLSMIAGGMTGARRGTPWNNAGRGLASGLMGYQGAQELARNEKKSAVEEQFKALQMGQIQRQMEQQKAQDAWRAGLPGMMQPRPTYSMINANDKPTGGAEQNQGFGPDITNSPIDLGQYTSQYKAPSAIGVDYSKGIDKQALQSYLLQQGSPFADDLIKNTLIPKAPAWEVGERFNAATGRKEKVMYDKNNPSDIRAFGGTEAEKIVTDNLGGKTIYRGENSVTPLGSAQHTATPDALMTDRRARSEGALNRGVTMRGQDQTNQRAIDTTKPLTEAQGNAALFGARAAEADKVLTDPDLKYSRTALAAKKGAESVWGIGGALGMAGNALLSPDTQRVEQAQRDFVNAVLRKESGAAIAESEFDNATKQYFPQPGDSDDVVAQKARNRKTAIKGMENIAGRGVFDAPEIEQPNKDQQKTAVRSFKLPPNAKSFEGKTLVDTETGKRFKAVNGKWQEEK